MNKLIEQLTDRTADYKDELFSTRDKTPEQRLCFATIRRAILDAFENTTHRASALEFIASNDSFWFADQISDKPECLVKKIRKLFDLPTA